MKKFQALKKSNDELALFWINDDVKIIKNRSNDDLALFVFNLKMLISSNKFVSICTVVAASGKADIGMNRLMQRFSNFFV